VEYWKNGNAIGVILMWEGVVLRGKLTKFVWCMYCVLINQSQNSEAVLYVGETRNV